MLYIISQQFVP